MQRQSSATQQLAEPTGDRGVRRYVGLIQRALAELPARVHELLRDPVDVASLVYFRIAFGAIMLWEVVRCFQYNRIARFSVETTVLFQSFAADLVYPWPGDGMTFHFAALGLLAVLITIGCCYRLATLSFFLGFGYVFLIDQAYFGSYSYLVLLISFLLILLPAHAGGSVDAWLRRRVRRRFVPGWSLRIVQAQIAIVYIFGGIAKLSSDWLNSRPVADWVSQQSDLPLLESWLAAPAVGWIVAYGGLLFDLAVVPLLCWRKTRPYAFAVAVLVHVVDSQLFDIGTFPWFMIAATAMFFPADWPRRFLPKKFGGLRLAVVASPLSFWQRAGVTFTVVYLSLQIAIPVQYFLYPGNRNANESEDRFAGEMKRHIEKRKVAANDIRTASAQGTQFVNTYDASGDLPNDTLEREAIADVRDEQLETSF